MKSIVEEASSISKAVDKAWQTAGKPQEFKVKVLEEAEKNFIGLVTKSAKISIIFEDNAKKHIKNKNNTYKAKDKGNNKPYKKEEKPSAKRIPLRKVNSKKDIESHKDNKKDLSNKNNQKNLNNKDVNLKKDKTIDRDLWSNSMVDFVKENILSTFKLIDKGDIKFDIRPENYHLFITFEKPIYKEIHRQKRLFSSIAMLTLTMLKNQYKRSLKGYKIVLLISQDKDK